MSSPTTDRRLGLNGGAAIKTPCAAATTAVITLSGEQTVDGVACVTGDRVLVKNQTSGVDNGIYTVDTGSWSRAYDCDGSYDLVCGSLIKVNGGTTNAGFWYLTTTGTITVGTTSLTFASASSVLAIVSAFMQTVNASTTASSAFALLAAAGLSFTGDISPTALSANTDDWAPTGFSTASTIRMDATAAWNLTGIAAGTDGRVICLHNISAFSVTLKNNATSTAANRFQLSNDYVLAGNSSVVLEYDSTTLRWRLFGQQASSTTTGVVNGLINGGQEIWQDGTTVSVTASSNGYGADQWVLSTGANQACTLSQVAGLASASQFASQVQRTAAQTGVTTLVYEQPFELNEIIKWRGKTISVSALLATGANWSPSGGTLTMALACGTGSAARRGIAGYTNETQPLSSALTIAAGTAAASYSATATAVVPTSTTQMALLFYWVPTGTAGAADYFQIDDVMFSETPGAVYERRKETQEIILCQRWYCKTFALTTAPAQSIGNQNGAIFGPGIAATLATTGSWRFPVEMRTTPTITTYSTNSANANWTDIANTVQETAAVQTANTSAITVSASTANNTNRFFLHAKATARF